MLSTAVILSALAVGLLVAAAARWCYVQRAMREAVDIMKRLETLENDLCYTDRDLRRAVQLFKMARFKHATGQRADLMRAAQTLAEAYRLQKLMQRSGRATVPGAVRVPRRGVRSVARIGA